MTSPRELYVRYLRGTPLGDAAHAIAHRSSQRWRSWLSPVQAVCYRASYVSRYYWDRARPAVRWLRESRESSNFTYDLTARNEAYLAEMLAVVLSRPSCEIADYIRELHQDAQLKRTVVERVTQLGRSTGMDPVARFGRRVGWYALARALKPSVIVETGVEKGLGALVLSAALLRNAQEGHPGRYYGTDIDPKAGALWGEPYQSTGVILYGDSIGSLAKLDQRIDLFINDSDHSAEYQAREYRTIAPKLSERAIIIADNAHVTDELLRFSSASGRRFMFFREEPAEHWYLGAGIGLSFK
jgi:predicted O-methyltransferase YrrM